MTLTEFKPYDPSATRDELLLKCLVDDELRNEVARLLLGHKREKGREVGTDLEEVWLQAGNKEEGTRVNGSAHSNLINSTSVTQGVTQGMNRSSDTRIKDGAL